MLTTTFTRRTRIDGKSSVSLWQPNRRVNPCLRNAKNKLFDGVLFLTKKVGFEGGVPGSRYHKELRLLFTKTVSLTTVCRVCHYTSMQDRGARQQSGVVQARSMTCWSKNLGNSWAIFPVLQDCISGYRRTNRAG